VSRRVTLPGAAELFRTTGGLSEPETQPGAGPDAAGQTPATSGEEPALTDARVMPADTGARRTRASSARSVATRPSGRQRHDEKITVYLSPDELIDLERARLTLRQDHGLAIDRGRIVREAVAVVLADLEAKGSASVLARRLRSG